LEPHKELKHLIEASSRHLIQSILFLWDGELKTKSTSPKRSAKSSSLTSISIPVRIFLIGFFVLFKIGVSILIDAPLTPARVPFFYHRPVLIKKIHSDNPDNLKNTN